MGPRPDGRGRRAPRGGGPARWRCVNGAAAGWPRKAPVFVQVQGRRRGVNGAAAGWPRKVSHDSDLSAASRMRQWGRGRMAAEGSLSTLSLSTQRRGVNGAAAGWPRKAGRGTRQRATPLRVNGAAAGWPRKGLYADSPLYGLAASMGPRPDGRGRSSMAARMLFEAISRQWGRGRMAAEGRRPGPHLSPPPRRQWGRGRMAAEGRRPAGRAVRPDGRQWGRGRMAAEGVTSARPAAGYPARQWGRGRMAAEGGRRHLVVTAVGWARQWGRGRMAAEGGPRWASRCRHTTRQWGRGRMAAEGHMPEPFIPGVVPASMGPRPDGRGRPQRQPLSWPSQCASMGPRPDGRGRGDAWVRGDMGTFASMGPRPDGRGRRALRAYPRAGKVRQWGRGRMAAEGREDLVEVVGHRRRQWGRGRMAAEGMYLVIDAERTFPASMGPRPDGRGRLFAGNLARLIVLGRQWGRGRMAAEGNHGGRRCAAPECVNGAAAGWPRKATSARRWQAWQTRVNGAAAGWPRKAGYECLPSASSVSVNGAAAGWPRKATRAAADLPTAPASMGSRPDGRGRDGLGAIARTAHPGVNGAAAGWPRKAAAD